MNAQIQTIFEERPAGVALLRAIRTFLERDDYLLRFDVNERTDHHQSHRTLSRPRASELQY